jgi:hypothetical protein
MHECLNTWKAKEAGEGSEIGTSFIILHFSVLLKSK